MNAQQDSSSQFDQFEMSDDGEVEKSAINLCLNKPKTWNWELTTSKSSPNIVFPKIQLFNKKGIILAVADDADQIFGSNVKQLDLNNNPVQSLVDVVKRNSKKLLRTQSQKLTYDEGPKEEGSSKKLEPAPIQVFSEKGIKIRDLNEKEFENMRPTEDAGAIRKNVLLQKSRSANEISSGKKKRRTTSMRSSNSILERISEFQRQSSSSDESVNSETQWKRPKYFLRTSKAGTLVVCEDSFLYKKTRRRHPKKLSSLKIQECDEEVVYPIHPRENTKLIPANGPVLSSTAAKSSQSASRYEKEIENIDNLITNLITSKEMRNDAELPSDAATDMGKINKNNFNYFSDEEENKTASNCGAARGQGEQRKKRRSSSTSREMSGCTEKGEIPNYSSRSANKRRDLTRTNGDQIVAINNHSSTAVSNIESTANLLNSTSDQVLLKLVRRLASLQYHPESYSPKKNNSASNISSCSINNNSDNNQLGRYHQNELDLKRSFRKIEKYNNIELFRKNSGRTEEDSVEANRQDNLKAQDINVKEVKKGNNNSILNHSNTNLNSNNKTFDNNKTNEFQHRQVKQDEDEGENEDDNNKNYNNNNNSKTKNKNDRKANGVVRTQPNGNEVEQSFEWKTNNFKENNSNNKNNNNKVGDNLNKNHYDSGTEYNIMGSNVSRNTEKGLSGRRTQSSGNLYNGKYSNGNKKSTSATASARTANKHQSKLDDKSAAATTNDNETALNEHGLVQPQITSVDATDSMYTTKKCHNKFSGSLPNHLDVDINDDEYHLQKSHIINTINEKGQYIADGMIVQHQLNQYYPPPPSYQPPAAQQHYQSPNLVLQNSSGSHNSSNNSNNNHSHNDNNNKGSSVTNSGNGTFKINPDNKPDLQLKLPIHRAANIDTGYDQGYGSERSPEDEVLPPLPMALPSIQDGQYKTNLTSQQQPLQQQQQLHHLHHHHQQQLQQQQPPPHQHLQQQLHQPQSQMLPTQSHPSSMTDNGKQYWNFDKFNLSQYNFITPDCIFYVEIAKGPRGLGLSVSGGVDTSAAFPGLIRIKRLFPHQAAWSTGMLQPGDILLETNGITLTGLTNYEALEVLRTMSNNVTLTVCRPRDEQYRKLSPPTEPPKPPQRLYLTQDSNQGYLMEPLDPLQINFCGEFEIILVKQQGSLGFTLRQEDESVLGHYVRALVKEPATTDGRIKPGDKIMAVNDVPISSMTHEEAVIFLRQAADVVKLRFYRDEAQTPVSAMSPNDSEYKGICQAAPRQKAHLRPEAINLLSDLAYRKQTPITDSLCSSFRSSNTTTSPRRLRRCTKSSGGGNASTLSDASSMTNQHGYVVSGDSTTYSDSDGSTLASQPNSFKIQAVSSGNSTASCYNSYKGYDCYCEDELFQMVDDDSSVCGDGERPNRPRYLELAGESGCTPTSSRKPRFQFSVAATNAYELNNLDNETLDAPTMYTISGGNGGLAAGACCCSNDQYIINGSCVHNKENSGSNNQDFNSLPCETFLVACKTESDLDNSNNCNNRSLYVQSFNHKNPIYQSVNVPIKDATSLYSSLGCNRDNSVCLGSLNVGSGVAATAAPRLSLASALTTTAAAGSAATATTTTTTTDGDNVKKEGTKSLLKWKGVMFSPDEQQKSEATGAAVARATPASDENGDTTTVDGNMGNDEATPTEADSSCATTLATNPTPGTDPELNFNCLTTDSEGNKIITVELNRGWNCRLGFSLQQDPNTKRSVITAIYSDSVAAKDGRLRAGDQLLTVNEESVAEKATNEIIDLLRIIRGSICITVMRPKQLSSEGGE